MSKRVVITADSTCDLPQELIEKYHIHIIPMVVVLNEKTYQDGVDVDPAAIYANVEATGNLPSTSAPAPSVYDEIFKELTAQGNAVVHISLSECFSSAYASACAVAAAFEDVYVVDSRNLSSGSGHIVVKAAQMAQQGIQAKEIYDTLQEIVPRVDASFILDQLDYLHKGGRCSSVAKLGANLLKLKPCIEVKDGKMTVGKKYRGSYESCLVSYVKDRLSQIDDIEKDLIFLTNTRCSDENVELVRKTIESIADFKEIVHNEAGCTITSHCGPNTLGILYIRKTPK